MVGRAAGPVASLPERVEQPQIDAASRFAVFEAPWGRREVSVIPRQAIARPTAGPLLIDEYDATIVVPPDFRASIDQAGNIVMERT